MRGQWLCCVSAAVLALISGAYSATAQEVQAAEMLLTIIGKSPVVARAIESELGAAAAGVLLGKSAAEVGKFAVSNNNIAEKVALGLSTADKLEWAGAVNTLRLSEFNSLATGVNAQRQSAINEGTSATSFFTYRRAVISNAEPSSLPVEPSDPSISGDFHRLIPPSPEIRRTISITPLGDIKFNPKLEVPLMTFGETRLQAEIESIPGGTLAAAAGTAGLASTCGQECLDAIRRSMKKLLGEEHDIPE